MSYADIWHNRKSESNISSFVPRTSLKHEHWISKTITLVFTENEVSDFIGKYSAKHNDRFDL